MALLVRKLRLRRRDVNLFLEIKGGVSTMMHPFCFIPNFVSGGTSRVGETNIFFSQKYIYLCVESVLGICLNSDVGQKCF